MDEDYLDHLQTRMAPDAKGARGRGKAPEMEVQRLIAPGARGLPQAGASTKQINHVVNLPCRARELLIRRERQHKREARAGDAAEP